MSKVSSLYEMASLMVSRSNNPIGLFASKIVNKFSLVHDMGISDVTLNHVDRLCGVDVGA